MDTTFLTLFRLMEKARKDRDSMGEIHVMKKLLQYGIARGLLKDKKDFGDDEQESEESILNRADASASLLRDFRGEEVGSVLDMTQEERLALIKRTEGLAEEVLPVFEMLANDSPLPAPKKEPLLV